MTGRTRRWATGSWSVEVLPIWVFGSTPPPAGSKAAVGEGPPFERAERVGFRIGLGSAVLVLLAFAWPMTAGQVYTHDDLGIDHLPLRHFYARCLAAGDNFTWIPDIGCGYYLLGEGQAGMFHPLHLALYWLLPLAAAFNLELLLSYPAMLAGTYLWLRRWSLRRDAAMLGAIVFSFSGFGFLHFLHLNVPAVTAHIPWLLLSIDVALRSTDRRTAACAEIAVTVLTTSQLLLGHPMTVWLSGLLELLYGLFLLRHRPGLGRLAAVVAAKLIGILLAGIQLVPSWDMLQQSVRATATAEFVSSESMHPLNLTQWVAPYLSNRRVFYGFPHEINLHTGVVAVLLVGWLVGRRRQLGPRRPLALGALVLGLVGLMLALGQYGPVYRLLYHVPVVGLFRCPGRYILFVHFAMAVASAVAFDDLARSAGRRAAGWRHLWPSAAIGVASLAPVALAWWAMRADAALAAWINTWPWVIAGPGLVLLGALTLTAAARGHRFALAGLVLLAAAELGFYDLSFVWAKPRTAEGQRLTASRPLQPPKASPFRVESKNNPFIMSGSRIANAYIGMYPKRQLEYLKLARLRVAGVRWVQTAHDLPAELAARVTSSPYGWEVPDPLPRVRLVAHARTSRDPNRDIEAIDVATTALVEVPLDLPGGPAGTALVQEDRPGHLRVITRAPTRQMLVVAESFHPGWRATVDGRPQPVLRAYGDFMGCVVEAGWHEVRLRFQPTSLRVGALISVLGLLGGAVLGLVTLFAGPGGWRQTAAVTWPPSARPEARSNPLSR